MGGFRPLACAALAGLALLLASCVLPGFREGVERVHQTWLDDNAQVYRTQGSRRVALTPAEAQRAAHSALEQIGLTVTQDDPGTGVVEADRPLTTADISGAVRDAELPRVHQIMAEAMVRSALQFQWEWARARSSWPPRRSRAPVEHLSSASACATARAIKTARTSSDAASFPRRSCAQGSTSSGAPSIRKSRR